MDITAVVLSFNSSKYLEGCLQAISNSMDSLGLKGEIILVENGSVDGSKELLQTLKGEISNKLQVIDSPVNLGTTTSRNQALRIAKGRQILIIDSDAICTAQALDALIKELECHPSCGLAVPQLSYGDGRFQLSVDHFPTVLRKLQRLFSLRSIEQSTAPPQSSIEVDYAISAFWLLRREVLQEVGLLDENIFYSPEDLDYCLRLWLGGWTIRYVPHAKAIHDAQELSRSKKLNGFFLRHGKGLAYYFWKHKYGIGLGRIKGKIAGSLRKKGVKSELYSLG